MDKGDEGKKHVDIVERICSMEDIARDMARDVGQAILPRIIDIVSRYPWLSDLEKVVRLMEYVWGMSVGLIFSSDYVCRRLNPSLCNVWGRVNDMEFYVRAIEEYIMAFRLAGKIIGEIRARYGKELDKIDEESREKFSIVEKMIRLGPETLKKCDFWRDEWDKLDYSLMEDIITGRPAKKIEEMVNEIIKALSKTHT